MTETLVQWFVTHLGGKAAKELIIFIISMIPILELRGGILAAGPAFLNIPTWRAIPICLVGNLIPIPFILLLIRPIFAWLRKTRLFRPLVEKLEKKAMSKSDRDPLFTENRFQIFRCHKISCRLIYPVDITAFIIPCPVLSKWKGHKEFV